MDDLVVYVTPKCHVCGEASSVVVSMDALFRWSSGTYIQDAFPDSNAEERELIKTGTHPACWDKIFGEEE